MAQNSERVYAISGAGLVKIGRSLQVSNRLQGLQAGSPVLLTLVASGPGSSKEERALHCHFAEYRQHGEWFKLNEEQIKSLITILKHPESLQYLVNKYIHQLPHEVNLAQNKPSNRGGSVRIGVTVRCRFCDKKFKTTNELRAYCCTDHRVKAKTTKRRWTP